MFRNFTKSKMYLCNFLIAIFIIVGITSNLVSSSSGKTGQTSAGCGTSSCHDGSANSATGISITSGSGNFNVNTNASINVTVRVTHSTLSKGGVDIAVKNSSSGGSNIGSISNLGSGLQSISGEITHTSAQSYTGGGIDYTFTWTAPSSAGTYYIQVAANSVDGNSDRINDIWNTTTQAITVTAGPTVSVTSPNGGENVCPGASTGIQWIASGFSSAKIELSSDGGSSYPTLLATVPANTGSYSWNVPGNQAIGSQYKIKVSDANNAATFDESNANFTVATATSITVQPQSKSMCTGSANSVWLTEVGNGLSYQWKKDGGEIFGATSRTYSIASVSVSDAGTYICTVSGACGAAFNSQAATITTVSGPAITLDPKGKTVCIGSNTAIWAEATGDNLTYKWQKDGSEINGANSKTLTIPNFQSLENSGIYKFLAISANCGVTVTSSSAIMQAGVVPTISLQPVKTTVCENTDANLFLTANGSNLQFQWYKDGSMVSNAITSTLTITKAQIAHTGNYYCKVTGTCDPAISSSTISLVVNTAPAIKLNPLSKNGTEGGSVTFTVATSFTGTTQYQWYKSNTLLTGKTLQYLEFTNLALADAGDYLCKLTNTCGTSTSLVATLNVISGASGVLTLAKNLVTFGEVSQSKPETKVLTDFISNTGKKAMTISSITVGGTEKDNFKIKGITLPATIDAGKSQSISVEFTPGNRGINVASVDVSTDDKQVASFGIIGKSSLDKPSISLDKPSYTINSALQNNTSGTITLTNASSFPEVITSPVTFSDNDFTLISPSGTFSVDAKSSKNLIYSFAPKTETLHSCTVTIKADFAISPVIAIIKGTVGANSVDYDEHLVNNINAVPNPIENMTEISFDIPNPQQFDFKIADANGKLIRVFNEQNYTSGHYKINWDGTDSNSQTLPSGIYYGIYQSGNKIKTIILNLKK